MIIWWATIINFWESSQGYTYLMGYYYLIGKSNVNIDIWKTTFLPQYVSTVIPPNSQFLGVRYIGTAYLETVSLRSYFTSEKSFWGFFSY